jgi:hypothetical protein
MEILAQIQADLLDPDVPLSAILRKAKVLASQLRSDELAMWVAQELDGYKNPNELPDYRLLGTSLFGTWTNGYWTLTNRGVPLFSIKDDDVRRMLTTLAVTEGIRTVEQFTQPQEGQHFKVSPDLTALVNTEVAEGGYGYSELNYSVGPHNFEQILDTVRNRLLDFVLRLGEWDPKAAPPGQDEVKQLVSVVIYNNPQGGPVSIFDQRGQHVDYQFNVAGNINLDGVQSVDQLVNQITHLRAEIDQAKRVGAVPEDIAVEAQYHLLEASRQAKSERPDRSTLLDNIRKAKDLLKDISAVASLVNALAKLADVAMKLIG